VRTARQAACLGPIFPRRKILPTSAEDRFTCRSAAAEWVAHRRVASGRCSGAGLAIQPAFTGCGRSSVGAVARAAGQFGPGLPLKMRHGLPVRPRAPAILHTFAKALARLAGA